MLRLFLITTALLATSATAEPIANWASSPGLSPSWRSAVEQFKTRVCVPETSDLGVPAYPGAELLSVNARGAPPECQKEERWTEIGGVILVSRSPYESIVNWYRTRLPKHREFPTHAGLIFVQANVENFEWNRDYARYPNVHVIHSLPESLTESGYTTMVEFNNHAL